MGAQVSFVGATEEAARETAQKNGYAEKLAVTKTSFKANSKVCAWPTLTTFRCTTCSIDSVSNSGLVDTRYPCSRTLCEFVIPCSGSAGTEGAIVSASDPSNNGHWMMSNPLACDRRFC